ncbi:hypothetical protein SCB49_02104 [unidentified eubacterium SCB49]|nr:hypothetical protein SCB49_02104 [unidentified eubacterium SCB49]
MERKIITTGDGSSSIQLTEWDEQYHSKHGAINEAVHVYIKTGLVHFIETNPSVHPVSVLEIGFGTGLNAFLTLLESNYRKVPIHYTGVEAYPLSELEIKSVNYAEMLETSSVPFLKMHETPWETKAEISSTFQLEKRKQLFEDITDQEVYDVIYYDAFGSRVQPELWEEPIFKIMYAALKKGGVLVTYAAKGSARRAMESCGFKVERLPGPPAKREMLRAIK